MSNNDKAAWNSMPWIPAKNFPFPHQIPQPQWTHPSESMLSLIANNQSLEMNPLLQTFHHAAASGNFGTVDLSMSSKNSSLAPIHAAYSNLQAPPISPSMNVAQSLNSVIHSTSPRKIGKITPVDTKILTGERRDNSTKSPHNSELELNRMQSNENFVGSPNRRIVTPDNHLSPRAPSAESADSMSTPKSRRKRKPNVTKKMTNELEIMHEKSENEILNDLRTDYSEKDMDIENDICSSERISEVCSPTTNSLIESNLQTPHVKSPPMKSPIVSPSNSQEQAISDKINVHRNLHFPPTHQDSDDCETIDKIAEMVSDLTCNKNPAPAPPPAQVAVPELPPTESPQKPINYSSQNNQEKLIDEVETRLEAMFAEPIAEPSANPSEVPVPNEPNQSEIDKKEENVEKVEEPASTSNSNGTNKKAASKNSPKKGGAKRRRPANNKNKGKNGKNKGKMNGNVDDLPKELKALAQKKEMNGKVKQKSENSYLGPLLQIQKDGSFNIVNQATNGDDDGEKQQNKIKKSVNSLDKSKVMIRGMHVSTLSNKYDADTKDMTWVCVFCKLGPHKFELGDLFGPYIISKTDPEYQFSQEDPKEDVFRQSNANKAVKFQRNNPPAGLTSPGTSSESERNTQPKKKRKLTPNSPMKSPTPKANGNPEPDIFNGMTKVDDNTFEVWLHEDCVVWASGVYIIGTKIVGIEAAIWSSTRHFCHFCSQNGAVLSCLHRGCDLEAHLTCAKSNKWKLVDNEFKTYCEIHAT